MQMVLCLLSMNFFYYLPIQSTGIDLRITLLQCLLALILIFFLTFFHRYAVPDVPYSVPAKIDSISLNKLLNELLRDSGGFAKAIDFDFLVQNELLRVPLNEHLQDRGLSTEAVVEIEYLERTPAPEPQDSIVHEDWVASIKVSDKL